MRPRARRLGFTLIELLVVIAVIGILAAMLLPVISASLRQAEIANCKSHLHQLGIATVAYAKDYRLYLPPALSWPACPIPQYAPNSSTIDAWPGRIGNFIHGLWPTYVGERDLFLCPGADMSWDDVGYPPVWPDGYTRWETGQGSYMYIGNFPDHLVASHLGWLPDAPPRPRRLSDDGDLPTMMDYFVVLLPSEEPWQGYFNNHIAGRRSMWGVNVLTLDGAVTWRHYGDARPRFEWRAGSTPIAFVY